MHTENENQLSGTLNKTEDIVSDNVRSQEFVIKFRHKFKEKVLIANKK